MSAEQALSTLKGKCGSWDDFCTLTAKFSSTMNLSALEGLSPLSVRQISSKEDIRLNTAIQTHMSMHVCIYHPAQEAKEAKRVYTPWICSCSVNRRWELPVQ